MCLIVEVFHDPPAARWRDVYSRIVVDVAYQLFTVNGDGLESRTLEERHSWVGALLPLEGIQVKPLGGQGGLVDVTDRQPAEDVSHHVVFALDRVYVDDHFCYI